MKSLEYDFAETLDLTLTDKSNLDPNGFREVSGYAGDLHFRFIVLDEFVERCI